MDREMQIENIKKALELENNIKNSILKYTELDDNKPSYDEKIKPKTEFKGIAAYGLSLVAFFAVIIISVIYLGNYDDIGTIAAVSVCAIMFPILICILFYAVYRVKLKNELNSEEYKSRLDKKTADTDKYYSEMKQLEVKINAMQKELAALYETEKPVPLQYRNRKTLQYIYDIMSTSDYDLKQAIDSYDKLKARELEEERIAAIRDAANRQANAIGWAATMNYIKRN